MENKQEQNKVTLTNAWNKASDFGKKVADNTKKIVNQTKESIREQQAKKYIIVTKKEFKSKEFKLPPIICIEDDQANRNFVEDAEAIGWIELHKGVQALHMYSFFANQSEIVFVPVSQSGDLYCQDAFDSNKYINANQVFGRATEEKLAELNNIAYSLGAKSCSIEIITDETNTYSKEVSVKAKKIAQFSSEFCDKKSNIKSGKAISYFEGHDNPIYPTLKWFAHDENVKGLIEMRCNKGIKSNILELNGSSCATMSSSIACALDDMLKLKIKGNISMEKQVIKEHSDKLIFEINF